MANLKDYIIKLTVTFVLSTGMPSHLSKGWTLVDNSPPTYLSTCFATYKAAKDKKLVKYIEDKESAHEVGADIMVPALLKYASNKYKILYEKSKWCAPSEEEKHISPMPRSLRSKNRLENQNFVIVVLFQEEEWQARKHQGALPTPQVAGWLCQALSGCPQEAQNVEWDQVLLVPRWHGQAMPRQLECPQASGLQVKAIQQKKREATGNSPTQEGASPKRKKLKHNKAMKGLAIQSDSEDSEWCTQGKSREVKSSKKNSYIHKLFSLAITLAYCLSTVEAEADPTVLGSPDSRDAKKWPQQSIKVHLNQGQLVDMTLLWVAVTTMVMVTLAVELISCVSMTKCTQTQNNVKNMIQMIESCQLSGPITLFWQ